MDPSLDFSLPEAPRRSGLRLVPWLTLLAALGCLGLLVSQAVSRGKSRRATETVSGDFLSDPERLKKLAEDLERRTLYGQAAVVWGEYAARADLEARDAAEITYRRGKCLKEAGMFAEAARFLSEVERLPLAQDHKRNAHVMLLDCLSAMGKEEGREQALRAFSIPGQKEEGTVVARVGGEEITREELRRELSQQVEVELRLRGSVIDPEELERKADELAAERLRDPELARRTLMQVPETEVLYREALAQGFAEGEEGKTLQEAILRYRHGYLAGRLMEEELQRALSAIGPTDLQNHYQANKEEYFERPAVEFSYLRFESEEEASRALATLSAGADAAATLRGRFQEGEGPAVQGEPIAGLGRSAEVTAHLLALDEGRVGNRAIAAGGAWYIFRADKKRPRRQKTFEEAEAQVRADLARLKQREALEKLQQRLTEKFRVEIVTEEGEEQPK